MSHGSRDDGPDASRGKSGGREKQRSRTGCRTCRSRKVKCDERPGGCRNCERLNIQCPNSPAYHVAFDAGSQDGDGDVSAIRTQAGLRRSRTYRSCNGCRSSKSRCSGERPVCLRCRQRKLDCIYDGKQVPAWVEAVAQANGLEGRSPNDLDITGRSLTPASSGASSNHRNTPNTPEFEGTSPPASPSQCSQVITVGGLSWLLSPELPGKDRIVLLIEEYFANIHSLRSFGFIHKPSFMQQLDERLRTRPKKDTLLYTICALGAKFFALKCADTAQLTEGFALKAGTQWAEKAIYLLFTNLNGISVENTMAIALLHEHELRVGKYASAFTLTGLAVRMAQALQINLEASSDVLCVEKKGLSASSREARRRLMWCIYVMDAWVGSGVDELTLINDADMRIQLPCNERSFVFQIPCIVEALQPGVTLPFIPAETRSGGPVDSIDLQAQFIRLVSLRKQVLRYVKHLDAGKRPWFPDSEFAILETALVQWHENLPLSLRFSKTAIYIRKESSQLGGLLFLHITYHQTLTDLNRIGMRDLFRIRAPIEFPAEQNDFLARVQDQCFDHATAIASVFDEAMRHEPDTLADTWLSVVAHDAARVIIHYGAKALGSSTSRNAGQRVGSCLHSLLRALQRMMPIHSLAKPLHASAVSMSQRAGLFIPPELDVSPTSERLPPVSDMDKLSLSVRPAQFTPEYMLNPLAIYRMARKEIHDQEKHAPEESPTCGINPSSLDQQLPSTEPPQVPFVAGSALMVDASSAPLLDGDSFPDLDFQFPTGFDDLQAYIPLMNNFSLPMQPAFDEMPSHDLGAFSTESVYPLPPEPTGTLDITMTSAPSETFAALEQTGWA